MTFFLDANALIYSAERNTERGRACASIMRAIALDDAPGRSSTAGLEEVWDLERRGRVGGIAGITRRLFDILTPLIAVTDELFATALALEGGTAGTNDRLHLAACIVHDIEVIVSSDRGFDGMADIERVNPTDATAVGRLLA